MTEYTGDEFTDRMNVEAIAEMEQREIKRLRAALEHIVYRAGAESVAGIIATEALNHRCL